MEEDFVQALLGNAALAALVGTRITWMSRPQGAGLPAVVLQVVSSPRDYTMDRRESLERPLIQIDIWGGDYPTAKITTRAVMAALDTLRTAPFLGAFIETERDNWEAGDGPQSDGSTEFYRVSLDVRVWHRNAA